MRAKRSNAEQTRAELQLANDELAAAGIDYYWPGSDEPVSVGERIAALRNQQSERIAQLATALAQRDALLARMGQFVDDVLHQVWVADDDDKLEAVTNDVYDEWMDRAQLLLSADAARRAAEQWRQMRDVLEAFVEAFGPVCLYGHDLEGGPYFDPAQAPIPAVIALRARRALGQTEGVQGDVQ